MKLYFRLTILCLILIALSLVVSNPPEEKFLNEVATDYGQIHGKLKLNREQLLELGESERSSYLIFSFYHYEFGTIGVQYFGIAGKIFYLKSYKAKREKRERKAYEI